MKYHDYNDLSADLFDPEKSTRWFLHNMLMNPNNPRSEVLIEHRLKSITGLGQNKSTMAAVATMLGISRGRVGALEQRERRRIEDNLKKIIIKSNEKVIVREVERLESKSQLPAPTIPIEALSLSVRSSNCLKNDDIVTVDQLCKKTERWLLATPNFGRKSLREIKMRLEELGLSLAEEAK